MDTNRGQRAYAHTQSADWMSFDEFAEYISSHNSVYDKADVAAVLTKSVRYLRELVLDGKKVNMGDLGSFYATVSSDGADTVADFNVNNITTVTMVWEKGERLKNMLPDAALQQVTTRATQKASLKAHKAGQTSASWDTAGVNDGAGDNQVDTGNGSATGTGNGSGTGTGTGDDLGGNVG